MIETKRFRDDHNQLLNIATEISKNLDIKEIRINARKVKSLISDLLSYLNVHLLVEDKALYPKLLNYPNQDVQSTAQKFIEEMGYFRDDVEKYKHKWVSSIEIQNDPDRFITETNKLLKTLSKRIKKEDSHLYKLVDELEHKK